MIGGSARRVERDSPRAAIDQRGFALVAVLMVLAILGVVGAEFAYSMRLEAAAVRAYKENVVASHLAEAALEQAIREIVAPQAEYPLAGEDDQLTFYTRERLALERLPRQKVPLGTGHFSYRLTDEEARVNINTAPRDRLDQLFLALGLDKRERDAIVDSIEDWRDPNEEHRLNGAESDDTYLKLPVPYRSRNANLESVFELLQIKGVTPAIFDGEDRRPGLRHVVTVKTGGQVNINTASPVVLRALRLSDAEVTEILQGRRDAPYVSVPARFAGRGLIVTSRTFRIEAEGEVDGRVRAKVVAVVAKGARNQPAVTVREWSGIQ